MQFARNALVVLLCSGWCATADETDIKKTAKSLCTEISTATLKSDFKKIVELTHPKLVEKMGGEEKAIKAMAAGFEQIKKAGVSVKSIDVGEPSNVVASKEELYLYVPLLIEMASTQGKLRQKSFVVGVSLDKGKSWLFVNGDLDMDTVKEILPNLPETLKLPERQQPLIEK